MYVNGYPCIILDSVALFIYPTQVYNSTFTNMKKFTLDWEAQNVRKYRQSK